MSDLHYLGTYSVRKIGKTEHGIHMPDEASGDYKIEMQNDGVIILTPQGVRK